MNKLTIQASSLAAFWRHLASGRLVDAVASAKTNLAAGQKCPRTLAQFGCVGIAAKQHRFAADCFSRSFAYEASGETLLAAEVNEMQWKSRDPRLEWLNLALGIDQKLILRHRDLVAVRKPRTRDDEKEIERQKCAVITEPEMVLLPALCRADQLGLDIGAAAGLYSHFIIENSGACLAFEPRIESVEVSRSRYDFWRERFRIEAVALSNVNGVGELRVPEVSIGWSTIEPTNRLLSKADEKLDRRLVETWRLDSVFLNSFGFAKVDVEGHEIAAIEGAEKWILTYRPNLLVECQNSHSPGAIQRVFNFLKVRGFALVVLRSGIMEVIDDVGEDQARDHLPYNLIFIPRERLDGFLSEAEKILESHVRNERQARSAIPRRTVCAGIVVRNDATFLRESVLSVVDFVDEVILVENGSLDNSRLLARQLAAENPRVRFIEIDDRALLAEARNQIDDECQAEFILWWDADFVAYSPTDKEAQSLPQLFELLREHPNANQVLFGGPNVGPTFELTMRSKRHQGLSGDTQLTRKGAMRFAVGEYIDTRAYTEPMRTIYRNAPPYAYLLHLDKVKPLGRMILRDMLYRYETVFPDEATRTRDHLQGWVSAEYPQFNYEVAKRSLLRSLAKDAVDFDMTQFGQHPGILSSFIGQPFFEAFVTDDGQRSIRQARPFPTDDCYDSFFSAFS